MVKQLAPSHKLFWLLMVVACMVLSGCSNRSDSASNQVNKPNSTTVSKGAENAVEDEVVFSFITDHERKLIIAYNAKNDRMMYRFFSKNALELELPNQSQDCWSLFSYMDGHEAVALNGGQMDLNYIVFSNGGYRYEVYDNYNVAGQGRVVGVDVIKLSDQSTVRIKGDADRAVGSLMFLNEKYPNLKRADLFLSGHK